MGTGQLNKLLIVDDEGNMRHFLRVLLERQGYQVEEAADGKEGVAKATGSQFAFILCDIRMPRLDGLEFLRRIRAAGVESTIIMMSAYGTVDVAIESMKLGAYDYISKPFKADEILLTLAKAEEREALRQENITLKRQVLHSGEGAGLNGMVGKSKSMQEVFSLARKVANYSTTVLITGESGTGKELVARGIHKESPRAEMPFVAINCGGIPENLLESELFGYVKGAFTGADRTKKGLFGEADGGTLFLDEIGELPLEMQVKLLRVLQEQEVRKVGSAVNEPVDVRIVAATARDLADQVAGRRFREDLFYRLNVVNLHLPPLRERVEDIAPLCEHFIDKISRKISKTIVDISPAAKNLLHRHTWPGNVRELENVMERAIILAEKDLILPETLPGFAATGPHNRRLEDFIGTYSLKKAKKIMEKQMISRAMEAVGGNKSKAAKLLELSYPSLLNKLKGYGLD